MLLHNPPPPWSQPLAVSPPPAACAGSDPSWSLGCSSSGRSCVPAHCATASCCSCCCLQGASRLLCCAVLRCPALQGLLWITHNIVNRNAPSLSHSARMRLGNEPRLHSHFLPIRHFLICVGDSLASQAFCLNHTIVSVCLASDCRSGRCKTAHCCYSYAC